MTYDELFTFENLYQAHLRARAGKTGKKDVISFELNLSKNLWSLYDSLHSCSYYVSGYHSFTIYEPKKREIQALTYKDRVVQHALCDLYLYPLLTNRFIYDNCACQKGKGTDFSQKRLTNFFADYYKKFGCNGYILKADIRHFFPSIDHEVLKFRISRVVIDRDILNLLYGIIDSYNADTGKGLPMGNQTSQLFALYYLDSLDRLIKERLRVKYYTRYMDDCVLLHNDKDYLRYCLKSMTALVEDELLLEFNEKTQISPIKNGVDYLGFHFYMTDTGKVIRRLRTKSKKKYKSRMKKLRTDYAAGLIDIDDIKKILPGFKGHLSRGHTYKLQCAVHKEFILVRKNKNNTSEEEQKNENYKADSIGSLNLGYATDGTAVKFSDVFGIGSGTDDI